MQFRKICSLSVKYEFCYCYLCGQPITEKQRWNLDHVHPKAKAVQQHRKIYVRFIIIATKPKQIYCWKNTGQNKDERFLLIVAFILGCGFGFMFSATIYRQDKIKSAQTQKNNTVEIIQTSQQIKDKIQNANEKCIDIFNIDIYECVQ